MKKSDVFTIRDLGLEDLPAYDDYWAMASDGYLRSIGIDPAKLSRQPRDLAEFSTRLKVPLRERKSHSLALEINGSLIGVVTLKHIKFCESAEAHIHLFRLESRGKGLASRFFVAALKKVFELFELKIIICEPLVSNEAPNRNPMTVNLGKSQGACAKPYCKEIQPGGNGSSAWELA